MIDVVGAIVGENGVRTGAAAGDLEPRVVAAPASADEAAELLARASAESWSVALAGAGTRIGGAGERDLDLLVTTERLGGEIDHAPADLIASVDAGVPLEALRDRLAEHDQWLPMDPPARAGATVGGLVATAAAGPLRLGYGTPRSHVLGLELVTGDGRRLRLGGRVVKNVAGYDLVKLVVGSRGTLGLITRVHLRLRPRPRHDATLRLASAERDALVGLARAALDLQPQPAALELLSPAAAGSALDGAEEWTLLARLHGHPDAVLEAKRRLEREAGEAWVGEIAAPAVAAAWRRLGRGEAAAEAYVRLADRPSEIANTLALADAWTEAADGVRIAAHAGDGIVRVWMGHASAVDADAWASAIGRAKGALTPRRGSVIAAGPPALLDGLAGESRNDAAARIEARLRSEFDPAGILVDIDPAVSCN